MTGLLTFHWADDYGALLQAYALKTCLSSLCGKTEIIPYAPFRLPGRYWRIPLRAVQCPDGSVSYSLNRPGLKRNMALGSIFNERKSRMREFRQKYLTDRPPVISSKLLSLKKYDHIFVGSDQVWNPDITIVLDDAYIGNIKKEKDCRLIAYAASFGGSSIPKKYWDKFAKYAGSSFSAVSVREKSAVSFAGELLKRQVTHVADPVLLLEKSEWEKLAVTPDDNGYILLHFTEWNRNMAMCAYMLASITGKKIIQTSLPLYEDISEWVQPCVGGGPAEFIGYIKNADCVITNSFHATLFSVLFEKQFFSFEHSVFGARSADMLREIGLESRLICGTEFPFVENIWKKIDWAEVHGRLDEERSRSIKFILDSI